MSERTVSTPVTRGAARRAIAVLVAVGALGFGAPLLTGGAGASMRPHDSEYLCGSSTTTSSTILFQSPNARPHGTIDCTPSTPLNLHVTRRGATVTGTWLPGDIPADWYLCTLIVGAVASGSTVRTYVDHCTFSGVNPAGAYQVRVVGLSTFGSSPIAQAKAPNPTVTTITCVKGAVVRHVTGVSPRCPKGFHRR